MLYCYIELFDFMQAIMLDNQKVLDAPLADLPVELVHIANQNNINIIYLSGTLEETIIATANEIRKIDNTKEIRMVKNV